MYIIAIAWIYVVLMMSITEASLIAGVMTFLMYCVFPLAIFLYLWLTPKRKKQRAYEVALMKSALAKNKTNPDNLTVLDTSVTDKENTHS